MRLWLRADGGPDIGIGHVMRQTAIAGSARAAGIEVTFVVAGDDELVLRLLARREMPSLVLDRREDDGWLDRLSDGDGVILDGYHLDPGLQTRARRAGAVVAVFDDGDQGTFDADVVVNIGRSTAPTYALPERCSVLFGPSFAPIRAEVAALRRARSPSTEHLVVTLGGSDATGLTARLIDALDEWGGFSSVTLVQGPLSPVTDGPEWLRIVRDPDEPGIVFDAASAALTAAGSTTWELLCMGVPTAAIQVAENQRGVLETVVRAGAALDAGDARSAPDALREVLDRLADPAVQTALSDAGQRLVDGHGARRVVESLLARGRR